MTKCPATQLTDTPAVVAIDPGTTESAILRWDGSRITNASIMSNGAVLTAIHSHSFGTDALAIEMIASYGMAVGREVFETCVWIGRFYQTWQQGNNGTEPRLIYRRDVKLHHCASPRAKDANIRQALIDRFGPPGTKAAQGVTYGIKSHLWAAFALAVYASDTDSDGAKRGNRWVAERSEVKGGETI